MRQRVIGFLSSKVFQTSFGMLTAACLLSACGSADSGSQTKASTSVSASASGNQTACSYGRNGVTESGKTKAECDALKAKYASSSPVTFPQSSVFTIPSPGTVAQAQTFPAPAPIVQAPVVQAPAAPAGAQTVSASASSTGGTQCQYNHNGVVETGNSQAECDALAKKYPSPFGF